jgi:hypothetical protein
MIFSILSRKGDLATGSSFLNCINSEAAFLKFFNEDKEIHWAVLVDNETGKIIVQCSRPIPKVTV